VGSGHVSVSADDSKQHRVVIVTGGARGIGRAIAERFHRDSAQVVVLDVDPVEYVADDHLRGLICDVSDSAAVDHAVAETVAMFGRLDVMVCNAGIGGGAPVAELSDAMFRHIVDVNLFGVFACCRAAARVMIPQNSGVIVTVGSVFGQDPPAGSAAYGAAKAGVAALTKSLARELGPHGIRVNCVSPGHIETDLYSAALERRANALGISVDEASDRERAPIPLGMFGSPDHVARVVAFLASDDGAYVTGQRINVDGGLQPI
jgi:NAD(P)-dependent dehydrogenase (short-subunit alcohol dehydrogenase family)